MIVALHGFLLRKHTENMGNLFFIYSSLIFLNHILTIRLMNGVQVLYGTMVVGLTITLMTLFGWHVYLILHNMTTIEVGFQLNVLH